MIEQKIDPQPRFLNSCYNLLLIYTCNSSKNLVWGKSNWKVFKLDKICNIENFFLIIFFYMIEVKINQTNLNC